uniref:Putative succinate dehydrogenase cytochrome b subunit n=1 Tax=Amblyomma tuberculatum TaxID=48802 RepID=A0A6M2E4B8_9ACAR
MAYAMRLANRASALSLLRPAMTLPTSCLAPMSGMTAKQAAATEHFFNKTGLSKAAVSSPEYLCATGDINAFTDPQGNWLWHGSICVRDWCDASCVLAPLPALRGGPAGHAYIARAHIPGQAGPGLALCYHTFNGMRHMAWDLGLGFGLKELYATGYFVLALSLAAGAVLAFK